MMIKRTMRRFLVTAVFAIGTGSGVAALAQQDEPPAEEGKRMYLKSTTPDGSLVCAKGCGLLTFCC